MAKDGTARGGARVGAGRKQKALADKVARGMSADVLSLPDPEDIEGGCNTAAERYSRKA